MPYFNITMNTAYTLLLLAAALATVDSTTLRGSHAEFQDSTESNHIQVLPNDRRRLMEDSTCTLYRKCVTYLPTEEHPNGHHKDSWICRLSQEDSSRMGAQFVDIVETDAVYARIAHATSGETQLKVSEAIVDTDSPRMYIPEDARMTVLEPRTASANKPAKTGTLKTLVIRVRDRNNVAPTLSAAKLKDDVFEDNVSLSSQNKACSYGKLNIVPFTGKTPLNRQINDGITEIKMDFDIRKDKEGLDQAAMNAARQQLGDLDDSRFDLVMFCFPPGHNFLAFAYPNSKYSFYNDKWCGFVAAQMHEVGHNLGLGHSGQVNEGEYGDASGVMGSAPPKDDARICYNAQKSFQLGWYEDKTKSINPLDGVRREFTLNGVSDYKRNNDALIALRLEQPSKSQDFYIGFNRATGIHSDTEESKNMVTIIRKEYGSPEQYSQSTKFGDLTPGQRMILKNFDDKKDILILFTGLHNGDARVVVTDNMSVTISQPKDHCKKFTIEVNTDNHPEDTSWYIVDNGGWGKAVAYSPAYTNNYQKYRQEVCLPMGQQPQTYKFSILDGYKDGMGIGSYNVFDSNNRKLFSGGHNLVQDEHTIQVPKDPNPAPATKPPTKSPTPNPTRAPTAKPTPSPPCETFTLELKTDKYPQDTSWKFVGDNGSYRAGSVKYNKQEAKYTHQICLVEGKTYDFQFLDTYKDGICCSKGEGYYRIIDSCGNEIVNSKKKDEDFEKKSHKIKVEKCVAVTTQDGICKNKKQRVRIENKSKKKSCKKLAERGKCNMKTETGKLVSELCAKSCGKCSIPQRITK